MKRAFEEKLGSTNMFLLLSLGGGKVPLHGRVLHPAWRKTLVAGGGGGLVTASFVGNAGPGLSMRRGLSGGVQSLQVVAAVEARGGGGSAFLPTIPS